MLSQPVARSSSALRPATSLLRATTQHPASLLAGRRSFQNSASRLETPTNAIPVTVRRPVGAFRGGLFGFLLGSTMAGAGVYYYILEEYRVSNELLTEDIYALQAAVQRIETYTRSLEDRVAEMQKRQ